MIYINNTMPPFIISIEGNIGSGKSTFVRFLQSKMKNIVFLQEPVKDWETIIDTNGESILSKFYKDQQTYSFSFQMMAYISRLAMIKETIQKNPNAIIVTERCLQTDRHVFAKMLYDEGKIEDINYEIYLKWFDTFYDDYPISHYIYLQTSPQTSYDRVLARNRPGEDISLDYLQKCHSYHEKWLETPTIKAKTSYINANDNKSCMEVWIKCVGKVIEKGVAQNRNITMNGMFNSI